MRLISLDYSQYANQPQEWEVNGLSFKGINLVVGKNAVGKSKVLNIISGLSSLLSSGTKLPWQDGKYDVHFDHNGQDLYYSLEFHDKKVVVEEFRQGDRVFLSRHEGGIGKIYAEKEGKDIEFQTPEDEIAVVARRDSIQHPYLEPLYQWASKVLVYHFGSTLGKDNLMVLGLGTNLILPQIDFRDENGVIGIYTYGYNKFGDSFDHAIREDMKAIGYDIRDVRSQELANVRLHALGQFSPNPFGMAVQEIDLPVITEHTDMSTGMFRALSIFVQLNCAFMEHYPSLIVIDDIGEGLDYERSCLLIDRLMSKTAEEDVQLVMSTNDRFVMNAVPLESWSILQRTGGHLRVFNYENSKKIFDDFKFSGLNNFDFFAYDYLNEDTGEEDINA